MDSLKRLQDIFSGFPTIGRRTAGRFVYYLLKLPQKDVDALVAAILEVKKQVKLCSFCYNPFEGPENLCAICRNPVRSRHLLCIVEKETDLLSVEAAGGFRGVYFILGASSTFRQRDIAGLRLKELVERVAAPQNFGLPESAITEIIIATNPTPEGKAASLLVEKSLKERIPRPRFKVTHLAQGLPAGGELEYADGETLGSAFDGRK